MGQVAVESKCIEPEALRRLCSELLATNGLADSDAWLVADSLVESNLRGIDSHGVARLPHYLRRIAASSIVPRPEMTLDQCSPSTARLDGGNGLGQLAMARAADEAIRLASQAGAGWVAVCHSSHCGALAYFGLQIARAGMVGLVFTHVDPMVLPYGASEPFCGTNPICVTAPSANGGHLCLDMATSVTPWNSVANAAIENAAIPLGWAVDRAGRDTTDPHQVAALYPFGGYKGSGLGLVIDMLCSLLSASPYGPDIPKMYGDLHQPRRLGGMVGAIDVGRLVPLEQFRDRLSEMLRRLGALRPAEPGGRVLFPGEPELLSRERRLATGIPVGLNVLEELDQLARQHGLATLTDCALPQAKNPTRCDTNTGPPAAAGAGEQP